MGIFGANEAAKHGEHSETIIGSSVRVEGKFVGSGNIVVEGHVVGSVKTKHDLHITAEANVQANLEATNVLVAGEVRGNIKATSRLELTETAKVFGDVEAKIISVGAGAVLNGKCVMLGEEAAHAEEQTGRDGGRDRSAKPAKNIRQAEAV